MVIFNGTGENAEDIVQCASTILSTPYGSMPYMRMGRTGAGKQHNVCGRWQYNKAKGGVGRWRIVFQI